MGWMFAVLILGSIFYSTKIIVEYTRFALETEPHILRLEQEAVELAEAGEREASLRDEIRGRLQGLRDWVADLQQKVTDLKGKMRAQQELHQRLQVEVYRHKIRASRT